ncbi:MAG: hypothetical protein IT374_13105 [Polyangiaceae bacterium]|nr:hypothetical protein [Polyangiaceae bacterium]
MGPLTPRGGRRITLAAALVGAGGCLTPVRHVAPTAKEPHAEVELMSVYETALGPELAQQFFLDGREVERSAPRDPSVAERHLTRARPGMQAVRVAGTFFHTVWRDERRARTESYSCGPAGRTCTRTVYDNVRVRHVVEDGGCAAELRAPLENGAAYRFDFRLLGQQRCSLECRVRVPTPDGAEPVFAPCEGATAGRP